MRYIDADALIEVLKSIPLRDLSDGKGICRVIFEDDFKNAIKSLDNAPTADVAPVVHGRWVELFDPTRPVKVIGAVPQDACCCSVCDGFLVGSDEYPAIGNYCPRCGAKMDLEVQDE